MPALTDATLQQRRKAALRLLRGQGGMCALTVDERRDLLVLVVWPELFAEQEADREAA